VNRGVLYYMMFPLLPTAALLQSTALARMEISNVKPDLVLLLVLVGALVYGSRTAVVWAFGGGLALDIFSGGPMGLSSLALMAAALVAGIGHRTLSRYNIFVPITTAVTGTVVYSFVYITLLVGLSLLQVTPHQIPIWETIQFTVIPATAYNTTLLLVATPFLNRVPESQDI
jgi:rod shape-determining protein MreD